MRGLYRLGLLMTAASFGVALGPAPALAQKPLFRLQLSGQWVEGTPLVAEESMVFLLARDGRLWDFKPTEAKSFSQAPGGFYALSQAQLRGQLAREFGSGFEVSGVGHYLVVHPKGQKNLWAPRFEELYRSFIHYFTARAFRPREPAFPLIAIVYPRQADFVRAARADGADNLDNLLGYYSPKTNRISLFDITAGKGGQDWTTNADTIIHEATHQSAFNVGMHNRFGQTPQWICEGLATMFEARGVWNNRVHHDQADRINRLQLETFRRKLDKRGPNAMAELVSSDRLFKSDTEGAYAQAWALSFFLSESEPRNYTQLLMKTAAVKDFTQYRAPDRLKDFTDIFGDNLELIDARMKRFLAELK